MKRIRLALLVVLAALATAVTVRVARLGAAVRFATVSYASGAPIELMGHTDVVPVTESHLKEWTHPPFSGARTDPSPVSDPSSPAFDLIASTIRAMLPGERVPVLPYLVMGGTDAKYWNGHSDRVFRFLAVPLGEGDVARVDGVNERIRVEDYVAAVGFFTGLLRGLGSLKE